MSSLSLRRSGGGWRRQTGPRAAAITLACWLARLAIRPRAPTHGPLPSNIGMSVLVVKPLALGDVLRATWFTRALRRGLPQAHVAFAVGDYAAPALANNPDLDEIVPMGMLGTPGRSKAGAYVGFVRELRRRGFDAAFVLDRSPLMALLPYLARIPYRVGLDSRRRGFPHTTRVAMDRDDNEVETYRRAAAAAGLDPREAAGVFRPTANDAAAARRLAEEFDLAAAELRVVMAPGGGVNPGAVDVTKRWPAERFAAAADWLIRTHRARVCLVGAAGDASSIAAVRRAMTETAVNLGGRTTFGQLGALTAASDLFVGNDSASSALAACVGTPTVTIFTSTEPWIYGVDAAHAVSVSTGSKTQGLGDAPTVAQVCQAVGRMLARRRQPSRLIE